MMRTLQIKLRPLLSLLIALCTPVVLAQTVTIGNVAPQTGQAKGVALGASGYTNITFIDLVHPATGDGTVTKVSFPFPVFGSCRKGVKIKFFRPEGNSLTLTAERGPLDGPSTDVSLTPPVPVRAGDLIGVVRAAPSYQCPGNFQVNPADAGQYLVYSFDASGTVAIDQGEKKRGTLLLSAVGESETTQRCTLKSFAGSYAFYEKGSSAILFPGSQPYLAHWAGAFAPFVTVGRVTMGPDGAGYGSFWIRVGSLNGGLEPIPVVVTITEMNEDCTGRFTAQFNLAGQTETIFERFILFDEGREFRALPISGGIETLAWIMEGHRIARPGQLLDVCGPQIARGKYVWSVENLIRFDTPYPILADTMLMQIDVAANGDYTGTMYEKMGPRGGIELPISGKIEVNPDCTFAQELRVVVEGVPFTDPIRGVFFDEGKRAFGLSVNSETIGMQNSFGQAVRIGY